MTSKEIIAEAKRRLLFEISCDAGYIHSKLFGSTKDGDELDIAYISRRPRFAIEEPHSRVIHYIWKIKFCSHGIVFCYADDEGEIPFELSVEELGRLADLCAKKVKQMLK